MNIFFCCENTPLKKVGCSAPRNNFYMGGNATREEKNRPSPWHSKKKVGKYNLCGLLKCDRKSKACLQHVTKPITRQMLDPSSTPAILCARARQQVETIKKQTITIAALLVRLCFYKYWSYYCPCCHRFKFDYKASHAKRNS